MDGHVHKSVVHLYGVAGEGVDGVETLLSVWLSVIALRYACTVLLRLSLSEAFSMANVDNQCRNIVPATQYAVNGKK